MSTRSWVRTVTELGAVTPSAFPTYANALIGEAQGSSNPAASVIRLFLDITFSIFFRPDYGAAPPQQWWMGFNPVVCAGVAGGEGDTALLAQGAPDPRVTLTGQLTPQLGVVPNAGGTVSMTWATSVPLESQGQRKSSVAGQPPVARAYMYLYDVDTIFHNPTLAPCWLMHVYLRALYQEP